MYKCFSIPLLLKSRRPPYLAHNNSSYSPPFSWTLAYSVHPPLQHLLSLDVINFSLSLPCTLYGSLHLQPPVLIRRALEDDHFDGITVSGCTLVLQTATSTCSPSWDVFAQCVQVCKAEGAPRLYQSNRLLSLQGRTKRLHTWWCYYTRIQYLHG